AFRRPLDEYPWLVFLVTVECRHETVHGFERYSAEALPCGIGGMLGKPSLAGKHQQGTLGRIAFHIPLLMTLAQIGIVTECARTHGKQQTRMHAGVYDAVTQTEIADRRIA